MQKLISLLYLLSAYGFYAQADYSSFYFKTPQPTDTPSIFEIDQSFTGSSYKENDSLIRIVVEKDSIYSEFGILFIVSPKELKKNNSLLIKDSLIFGIQPKKGIPFKKIEDTIYAVLIQQDLLFKPDSNHILKFKNETYFLNTKNENDLFSTTLLNLEKDTLFLKETDHLSVFDLIKKFKMLEESSNKKMKTYIANPSVDELLLFIKQGGFNELIKYRL